MASATRSGAGIEVSAINVCRGFPAGTSTTSSSDARIERGHGRQTRDRARQLSAIEQRVRVRPLLHGVAEPFRRWRRPERLTELSQHDGRIRVDLVRSEGAHAPRRTNPAACGTCATSSRHASGSSIRRSRDDLEVAIARAECARDAIDGGRRRIVADEVRGEFRRDELRRRWVPAQCANRALAFGEAVFLVVLLEHGLRSRLVEHFAGR